MAMQQEFQAESLGVASAIASGRALTLLNDLQRFQSTTEPGTGTCSRYCDRHVLVTGVTRPFVFSGPPLVGLSPHDVAKDDINYD